MIPPGKYIIRNKDLIWRMVENKAFLISNDASKVHTLNSVGSFIWKLAEGNLTFEQVILKVCDHFEISEETAREDTNDFIEELMDKGIAALSDSSLDNK